jgi:uncharacterized protein
LKYLVTTFRTENFNEDVIPRHYAFLTDLRASGKLEGGGPFTDRSGGAYILIADSLLEAREIAFKDPVHLEHCSLVNVHEWNFA